MNTDCTYKTREEIVSWLKENLSPERFEHTLGVEEAAISLAKRYGIDPKKASLAGLLHDCAKCLDKEELYKIIKNEIKNVSDTELMNYKIFHAPVGEHFCKNIFKIDDPEILSAIRHHTLGKVDMTLFEKIIFLADKIEKRTRPEDYVKTLEDALNSAEGVEGLNNALFICFRETVKSLAVRELAICPVTIDVYNQLLEQTKNARN